MTAIRLNLSMKKLFFLTAGLFLISNCFGQSKFNVDSISYKFRCDTIFSDALKEKRIVKTWLPADYLKEKTYPVFFVLDEDWMFEPSMLQVKQFIDSKIIPPSIVVGIHSANRSKDLRLGIDGNFTENSAAFYTFLNTELFSYLSKTITKPAFPILIGHSDAAVFLRKC